MTTAFSCLTPTRFIFAVSALCIILTDPPAQPPADGSPSGETIAPVDSTGHFTSDTGSDSLNVAGPTDTSAADSTHSGIAVQPSGTHSQKRSGPAVSPESLYTGISPEQDYLARAYVRQTYAFSWEGAARTAKKLQKIERRDKLPPLSTLLMVSSRVIRILNGEFQHEHERKQMIKEIEELKVKLLRQFSGRMQPDSLLPINLFIEGGVRGLCAALKIESNVVEAAIDGFAALNRLERVVAISPGFNDACLGLGIFYCSLARAPVIVRAALNISGHQVSFDDGLDYLRTSARYGRYTAETASLYLVQFLTPYLGHLVAEKNRILSTLQQRYPDNPYYVFLEVDEAICFHPQRLDQSYALRLEETACSWKGDDFSLRRYNQLVRYQVLFMADTIMPDTPLPDTTFDLKEFSFYPQFLEALHEQRAIRQNGESPPAPKRDTLTKSASAAVRMLGLSAMSTTRRNFYEWHIRDALKIR